MAEIIYKRISDLDAASQPLGGSEIAEISQGGVSKKVTLTNIFGSGWWAALRAAFSAFVAPEATHAADSDTLDGESASDFHDAAQLTGAIPLVNIPVELTGINAATATVSERANRVNLNNGSISDATYSEIISAFVASGSLLNIGDVIVCSGVIKYSTFVLVVSAAKRVSLTAYSLIGFDLTSNQSSSTQFTGGSTQYPCSLCW